MLIERYYDKNGRAAYVILWRLKEGAPRELMRAEYAWATGFQELWAAGVDWTQGELDAPE